MTEEDMKLTIKNKIIQIREQVEKQKFNNDLAIKLGFMLQATIISQSISAYLESANWLEDLLKEKP